jgi:hypothetical protein
MNNQKLSFTEFLLQKYSHLQQYYKTEEEFKQHLLSGEVTMPMLDAIKYQFEYEVSDAGEKQRQEHSED